MIHKPLHRKLTIEQHERHQKLEKKVGPPEMYVVVATLVTGSTQNCHRADIAVFNIECISTVMVIFGMLFIPSSYNLLTPNLTNGEI